MDIGDWTGAVVAARRAIAVDESLGDPWGVAINQGNLVVALLHGEGPERAYEVLRDVAEDAVALGDTELSIDLLDVSAAIWAGMGHPDRAATLLGAAEKERRSTGIPRATPDQEHLDRFIGPARGSLSRAAWDEALAGGARLTVEEAIALATTDQLVPSPAAH